MKFRYALAAVGALAALSVRSLEADPAPMRSISVVTIDVPHYAGGHTEIDLDEAFLARLSPKFTLVAEAGVKRYAPDNVVPRGGFGAAWDFGGGFYADGLFLFGWASALSLPEYKAGLAFNYETDTAYASARSVLRSEQGSFSSVSTFMGQWTWSKGFRVLGMYGFAWERDVGLGHSVWLEAAAPLLPYLKPRLGGTLSRETNGDLYATIRAGLEVLPWRDVKILCIAEPYFLDYSGAFTMTVAADVSFR